jgi:hypothetical protein
LFFIDDKSTFANDLTKAPKKAKKDKSIFAAGELFKEISHYKDISRGGAVGSSLGS